MYKINEAVTLKLTCGSGFDGKSKSLLHFLGFRFDTLLEPHHETRLSDN
jgi:hypothetical protein